MKILNLALLALCVISVPAFAQTTAAPAKCPCDFSGQSFGQLLGEFKQGSVTCSMQSGMKVIDAGGKPEVVNTLSARALVLSKESFTPRAWLLEYYSADSSPRFGVGSFCANSMSAALNSKERKAITTFAQYQSCLRDFLAALKTIKVDCNQLEAQLPDPPQNPKQMPQQNPLNDLMQSIPLKFGTE